MKRIKSTVLAAAALAFGLVLAAPTAPTAEAAGGVEVPHQEWSFDGIFGTFDQAQLQRGLQVYRQICAGCHGLERVAFRNLADLGYNEDEIKAIAADYEVMDGPNDEGEMFFRPAIAADHFPSPFPNEQAARFANGGAYPLDLSLLAKARAGGPDYLYALLTGYPEEIPEDADIPADRYYNEYYPGHAISMAQPLWGDDVFYEDGTEATIEQEAKDVSAFLMWAAEPSLEDRKSMGVKVILFLSILAVFLYITKRKVWAKMPH